MCVKKESLYICVSAQKCVFLSQPFWYLFTLRSKVNRAIKAGFHLLCSSPRHVPCVSRCFPVCVVPLELSISKCVHDCGAKACMCLNLSSCMCVLPLSNSCPDVHRNPSSKRTNAQGVRIVRTCRKPLKQPMLGVK